MVDSVSQTPAAVNGVTYKESTDSDSLTGGQSLNETFDMFLSLLTTQLKNQDPLDPMDNTEFVNQLTQFTQTEQALNTNKKLDELIALQSGNQLSSALGYVGSTIRADSIALNLDEDGADIVYGLTANSETTTIKIIDESGRTVRTLTGAKTAGQHEIHWDGKDDDGNNMPDGIYGFAVVAQDADENPIQTAQGIEDVVDGIQMNNDEIILTLGEVEIPLSSIQSVQKSSTSLNDVEGNA